MPKTNISDSRTSIANTHTHVFLNDSKQIMQSEYPFGRNCDLTDIEKCVFNRVNWTKYAEHYYADEFDCLKFL